uniref:KPRO n=1 Tax=Arundo donax TaxID=35708 RepID=A0A0A9E5F9_ARUDO
MTATTYIRCYACYLSRYWNQNCLSWSNSECYGVQLVTVFFLHTDCEIYGCLPQPIQVGLCYYQSSRKVHMESDTSWPYQSKQYAGLKTSSPALKNEDKVSMVASMSTFYV